MTSRSYAQLLADGYGSRADHYARVSTSVVNSGPASGMRVIDVDMAEGFSIRVLPDRGLDIGAASAFGMPIGWTSKVGESLPLPRADNMAWLERYLGGLLVTCGPDNVGLPCVDGDEEFGLHGSWTFLRSDNVTVERSVVTVAELAQLAVTVSGRLRLVTALGRNLEIDRSIRVFTGIARVEIVDALHNAGFDPEPVPMLYHVNVGSPLWGPGASVLYPDGEIVVPRNAHAASKLDQRDVAPIAEPNADEYVFERSGQHGPVVVESPGCGLALTLEWTQASLPRFHQWIHPAAGVYALGIEPSNVALAGRGAERDAGTLPMLQPGETRRFGVTVAVQKL